VRIRRLWDKRFRWVHSVHYHDYRSFRFGGLRRWLDTRFIFPAPDRLVAVSETVRKSLPLLENTVVIENGVDLSPAEQAGNRTWDSRIASPGPGRPQGNISPFEDGPVLGTVSMLRPEKGVEDLILAVAQLAHTHPKIRLRVAGDGPLMGRMRKLVSEAGLTDRVELMGYLADLDPFYASLDVYVQPSMEEGFGLATLSAMRFGIPIVASKVGHLPHLLGDGEFGQLVPRDARFVDSLTQGIETVLSSPTAYREKSAAGLSHWSPRLNSEVMVRRYRDEYSDALRPGVCMIAPIVTHSTGGLQRQVHLQSRALVRAGYMVFVLQRKDPTLESDPVKAKAWDHVRFLLTPDVFVGMKGPNQLPERARGLVFVLSGIFQVFKFRHRIFICHAHQLYSPTLVGVVARIFFGKPLVVKVTASGTMGEVAELKQLPFRRLRKLAFNLIDRLVVLTPSMVSEVRGLGFAPHRIRLIPNCVELPDSPVRYRQGKGPFRLLFTGRLSKEKSLETAIQAVGLLLRRGRDVHFDLVGRADPDRDVLPVLRAEALRLGDPGRVTFHGYRTELETYYREADAFILPSESEGMSNALLEALSYGLVCLASDIQPNRFLIRNGENGLLFPHGSPEALASHIEDLVLDSESVGRPMASRLSVAARADVAARFSVSRVGEEIGALYQEVAGGALRSST
jgi:glycosyltransferase involved in cell wall biosynthesis